MIVSTCIYTEISLSLRLIRRLFSQREGESEGVRKRERERDAQWKREGEKVFLFAKLCASFHFQPL